MPISKTVALLALGVLVGSGAACSAGRRCSLPADRIREVTQPLDVHPDCRLQAEGLIVLDEPEGLARAITCEAGTEPAVDFDRHRVLIIHHPHGPVAWLAGLVPNPASGGLVAHVVSTNHCGGTPPNPRPLLLLIPAGGGPVVFRECHERTDCGPCCIP